jgi:hypothetical protein
MSKLHGRAWQLAIADVPCSWNTAPRVGERAVLRPAEQHGRDGLAPRAMRTFARWRGSWTISLWMSQSLAMSRIAMCPDAVVVRLGGQWIHCPCRFFLDRPAGNQLISELGVSAPQVMMRRRVASRILYEHVGDLRPDGRPHARRVRRRFTHGGGGLLHVSGLMRSFFIVRAGLRWLRRRHCEARLGFEVRRRSHFVFSGRDEE